MIYMRRGHRRTIPIFAGLFILFVAVIVMVQNARIFSLGNQQAKNLIYETVRKAGPSRGDITIKKYEVIGNKINLDLTGTTIDDGDLLTAPWLVTQDLLPKIFARTTGKRVTICWNDYLTVSYRKNDYMKLKKSLSSASDKEQCINFLRYSESYIWINPSVWDLATGEGGLFSKAEVPISKNVAGS